VIDREAVAREMFPAEYAAIDDDHPMAPEKIAAVDTEILRRQYWAACLETYYMEMPKWVEQKVRAIVGEIAPWTR
jgi:hypothetical protein